MNFARVTYAIAMGVPRVSLGKKEKGGKSFSLEEFSTERAATTVNSGQWTRKVEHC